MQNPPSPQAFGPAVNRFTDVMAHNDKFAFKGVRRLASAARVSPSSVSRFINGQINPSFLLVARLTEALEKQLGFHIDPRDLIAEDGRFLNRFVCDVVGCRGCLPDRAWDEDGSVKPAFKDIKSGEWVTSRHPQGFIPGKENHE